MARQMHSVHLKMQPGSMNSSPSPKIFSGYLPEITSTYTTMMISLLLLSRQQQPGSKNILVDFFHTNINRVEEAELFSLPKWLILLNASARGKEGSRLSC